MRHPAVPCLEVVAGGVWWVVGAIALAAGTGTVVLAAGLGVTGALVVAVTRRYGSGAPLPRGDRTRLLQIVIGAVVLVVIAGSVLGLVTLGELAVPVSCAITGCALFPLSTLLDARSLLAAGAALLVLGATGALLALDLAGPLYPHGLVGMAAGAVLWVTSAVRTGLLSEARGRVGP